MPRVYPAGAFEDSFSSTERAERRRGLRSEVDASDISALSAEKRVPPTYAEADASKARVAWDDDKGLIGTTLTLGRLWVEIGPRCGGRVSFLDS